jgi:hypothetical protein
VPPGAGRRRFRCEERGKGVETMIEKGFTILIGDANFGEERA